VKNGDISNQAGYTIAFRCEDCLIKYKEGGVKNVVLNKVLGKARRAEIDELYRSTMEHLYRNTEFVVDLVIQRDNYTADLKEIIDSLPFSRIVVIEKDTQISQRLLIGDITFYVDDDDYRRSLVNSKYAMKLSELSQHIKRRV
jgi:hypothetical protein